MAMDLDAVLSQVRREHTPTDSDRERIGAALTTALAVGSAIGAAQLSTAVGLKGASGLTGAAGLKGAAGLTGVTGLTSETGLIGAVGLTSAAGLEGAAAVKVAALGLPLWIKGALSASVLITAVGGGIYAAGIGKQASEPPRSLQSFDVPAMTPPARGASAARGVPDELAVAEPVVVHDPSPEVAAQTPPRVAHVVPKGSPPRAAASSPVPGDGHPSLTSLGELRLIGEASKALREGRTEEARSALTEHQKRYSNTALVQERAGLELLARCAEGANTATRQAAADFLKSSPNSPLAGSIRRECLD